RVKAPQPVQTATGLVEIGPGMPPPPWPNRRGRKASPMGGPRPPLRQSLTHQPSAFLSQADAAVPNIEQKPSVLDSVVHRNKQRRLVADSLPLLHGSPVSELVEFPAQQEGQLISRSTLPHSAP